MTTVKSKKILENIKFGCIGIIILIKNHSLNMTRGFITVIRKFIKPLYDQSSRFGVHGS